MTDDRTRGLLFDMDGTLLDSTPLVEQIWTEFASRHQHDPARVLAFAHGRPTRATVAEFLPPGLDVEAEVARIAAAEAAETWGIAALPGAREYLGGLEPHQWAVVTSATRAVAEIRMTAAGLPLPEVLVTSEDVEHGKPSPEGYLLAARSLGLDPAACRVFEDAGPGVVAGRSSGAEVTVVGGYTGEETHGLPRIADFTELVQRDSDGLLAAGVSRR
ncbi:HAD-IA family hydrolase [Cellulomonas taurus]|uniref:HAD-IA family hydrolase n=1 Tax=Cellulomonas taurus TaxID=2729175 RepID=UPI00145EEEF4|nr:HAD-IA family hydrolase [Cellulomonas taurus]